MAIQDNREAHCQGKHPRHTLVFVAIQRGQEARQDDKILLFLGQCQAYSQAYKNAAGQALEELSVLRPACQPFPDRS